jgi:mRNA interferase MazF
MVWPVSSGGAESVTPSRGELWMVDLNPTRGREQSGLRPALILSVDKFNHGPAELVIVVPITKTKRGIPTHILVPAGEAGLSVDSYIKCEDLRSISKDRLVRPMGRVTAPRIDSVQRYVRLLLGL